MDVTETVARKLHEDGPHTYDELLRWHSWTSDEGYLSQLARLSSALFYLFAGGHIEIHNGAYQLTQKGQTMIRAWSEATQ